MFSSWLSRLLEAPWLSLMKGRSVVRLLSVRPFPSVEGSGTTIRLPSLRLRTSMKVPLRVSPLRLFLFHISIQGSLPPPFGTDAGQIRRDADQCSESQDRGKRNGSQVEIARRDKPKPADQ